MKNIMQKMKETFAKGKEKLKQVDAKKLLASRTFLVCSCVVLIVAAVGVSALVGRNTGVPKQEESETGKQLGNSVLVNETLSGVHNESTASETIATDPDDLLAVTVLNRTAVREDAMAVLQKIADNPDAMPNEKEEALSQISSIMKDMEAEANIETLALAKGIPECVAVISGNQCSVIVDAETLTEEECARIVEIVFEQSGIRPISTKVIPARTAEE